MVGLLLFGKGKNEEVVPPLPSRSGGILDKLGPEEAETIGGEDRGFVGVGMAGQEQVLHQRKVWPMFHRVAGLTHCMRIEVRLEVEHGQEQRKGRWRG